MTIAAAVLAAAQLLARSVLPNDSAVTVKQVSYYHRQAYAAAGSASFTFFNASKSKYLTNLAIANQVPGGHILMARAIRLRLVPNEAFSTGAAAVAAATYVSAVTPLTNAQELLQIYNQGYWEFRVNNRPMADGFGINKLGAGSSVQLDVGCVTTATTTDRAITNVRNGDARYDNGWIFTPALVIPEGITFEMSLEFATALPLTNGGTIQADLDGVLIGPANA